MMVWVLLISMLHGTWYPSSMRNMETEAGCIDFGNGMIEASKSTNNKAIRFVCIHIPKKDADDLFPQMNFKNNNCPCQ